jgi:hypothetical protein
MRGSCRAIFLVVLISFSGLPLFAQISCAKLPLFSKSLDLVKRIGGFKTKENHVYVPTESHQYLKSKLDAMIEKYQLEAHYSYMFSVGKEQKQSIYEHTLNTLRVFLHQIQFESFQELEARENISIAKTISYALMVHDVGKAFAYEKGGSHYQDAFNIPLSESLINRFEGLQRLEKEIAKSLVRNARLGSLLQGEQTKDAYKDYEMFLVEKARELKIPIPAYVRMARLFFVSDAGSYDILVKDKNVFKLHESGRLSINSQAYKSFEAKWGIRFSDNGLFEFSI